MYNYITKELPPLLDASVPLLVGVKSVRGHSIGRHGAIICALESASNYKSVSALSPICSPVNFVWGIGCFEAYLGDDANAWQAYDATALIDAGAKFVDILIDQGTADEFYDEKQLLPENFLAACERTGQAVTLRMQDDYDHSYHFIASFIGEHIAYHAKALKA